MFNIMKHSSSYTGKRLNGLEIPLAGLMLMVGVSSGNANAVPANSSHAAKQQIAQSRSASPAPTNSMTNGVYLYGQSPKPEEIGKEYVVFEVRGDRVVGAVYMPRSEFSCFYGTTKAQQLNVSMVDPLGGETADSTPPEKQPSQRVAATGDYRGIDQVSSPFSVKLQNYTRIANVSDNDKRILGMCKADYQERAWGR